MITSFKRTVGKLILHTHFSFCKSASLASIYILVWSKKKEGVESKKEGVGNKKEGSKQKEGVGIPLLGEHPCLIFIDFFDSMVL